MQRTRQRKRRRGMVLLGRISFFLFFFWEGVVEDRGGLEGRVRFW